MKIIFIDPEPPTPVGGGIRTYIGLTAALCRSRGMNVRVYSHNPEHYAGIETLPIGRKPFSTRGLRGLAYRLVYAEAVAFEHASWLAEELRRIDFDVAEFADFQGYAYYALRDPGLRSKTLLRVHTPLHLVYADAGRGKGLSYQLLRHRERSSLLRAALITAPSGEFAQEKLPWLKNYRVIPNPPPIENSSSGDGRRATGEKSPLINVETNARHPTPDARQPFPIAFLGRLEPRKGPLVLLRAFLSLAEQYPHATLTFIGDAADPGYATEMRRIEAQAPESIRARIHWLAAQGGDKGELLRKFSCLVVPSHWENSPYVFWEGMAAGIPCLGTETGEMKRARSLTGAPEIPAGNAEALARALRQLLVSPEMRSRLVQRQTEYLLKVAEASSGLTDFYQACAAANP